MTVHGHAHRGTAEGRTTGGSPVYNVAMPVLRATDKDRPPFRILEIPAAATPERAEEAALATSAAAESPS